LTAFIIKHKFVFYFVKINVLNFLLILQK